MESSRKVKKEWVLKSHSHNEETIALLVQKLRISKLCASLVCDRSGNTYDEAYQFCNCSSIEGREPSTLADIDKAVKRILEAVENGNEIVAIYGDYDADGVTSTSMLYLYLTSLGLAVGYYIPSRKDEGYGMSKAAINRLKAKGVTLIVTVDTGVTAIDEIDYANSLGIDVIVTDHHECRPTLPNAVAVINPHRPDCNYPFKDLAGVGVAYKLACAVEIERAIRENRDTYQAARQVFLKYCDLVAIGTIADVMPIVDENRVIVAMGLTKIKGLCRLGVKALIKAATASSASQTPRPINSTFIGYTIAPRINAAGRMGNASLAVELLLAEDANTATLIAEELCALNKQRQAEENKIVETAYRQIEDEDSDIFVSDGVLVLDDNNWQQGVIGIVSSRITERYSAPSILITFEGMDAVVGETPYDIGKGSGRSVDGLNLVEALSECSDLLEKFGGHELAAGLSIKRGNLPEFRRRINEYAVPRLKNAIRTQRFEADYELELEDVTIELAEQLSVIMEPCGPGNPEPTFVIKDLRVFDRRSIGSGKHQRFNLCKGDNNIVALYFGVTETEIPFDEGSLVDVLCTISVNNYNNRKSVQLIVNDMRHADDPYQRRAGSRTRYNDIMTGGSFTEEERFLPSRDDCALIFRLFLSKLDGKRFISENELEKKYLPSIPEDIRPNLVKFRIVLEIFNELDLINLEYLNIVKEEDGDRWNLPAFLYGVSKGSASKIDLESSQILARLRRQLS